MAVRLLFRISVLLVLTQIIYRAVTKQCTNGGYEVSVFGWMLQKHIYDTMFAELPDACLIACRKDDRCQSFNYIISLSTCEFNNRTKEARPEDFIANPDRFYFRRDMKRVPLGSIPELPAETCKEIKASEEGQAVSKKYWLSNIKPGVPVLAYCNMTTEDINECTVSPSVCDVNANCKNNKGSYLCSCKVGFTGDGKNCKDINECTASPAVCDVNANCQNNKGSYLCSCKVGFTGDGKNCKGFRAVFTNLATSGKQGPASLGSHYSGQDHDGQVTLVSGIQQWTVPYTGDYRIEAIGAAGGYDIYSNRGQYQGRGARMNGTFPLSKGETIQILVGQEGGINTNSQASGGGGGTFVVRGNNTPSLIAGGGGGIEYAYSRHTECDASTGTAGRAGYKSWSGGSGGHGAQTASNGASGGGGGGFYSSGRSSIYFGGTKGSGGEGGKGFLQGGVGGRAFSNSADGGFGGGGGAYGSGGGGGGGGGYSGGSSGQNSADSCGGGGGSYNAGNNQQNECCYNTAGHGQASEDFWTSRSD